MKKQEIVLRNQMRSAFGIAPPSYHEGMRDTLASIKEDSAMKKRHFSVAFAVILIILLCSTALAMHQFGVLDFIFPNGEVEQKITDAVQSSFVQQGGDFGAVRAHVRDAVSDGIAVHAVVAFEVTDPNDVILMEYDGDVDENGTPFHEYPHDGAFEDDTEKWVVWYMAADVDGKPVNLGVEYQYENPQTLLIQYIIDLRCFEDLPSEIKVNWTPQVYQWGEADERDQTADPITVTLGTQGMKQTRVTSTQEVEFLGMKTTALEAILTPLATYVNLSYETLPYGDGVDIDQAVSQWQENYSNMWFDLLDASGNPVQSFTGGSKGGNDDINPIMEEVRQIYGALPSVPDSLTFQPYISYLPPAEKLPTITLTVQEE